MRDRPRVDPRVPSSCATGNTILVFPSALPPPPVSKALVGRPSFDPAALPALVALPDQLPMFVPLPTAASDSLRPFLLFPLRLVRGVHVCAQVAIGHEVVVPLAVVRYPTLDFVSAFLAGHYRQYRFATKVPYSIRAAVSPPKCRAAMPLHLEQK